MNTKTPVLEVEHLHPDQRLASLLSSELARHCHALPVAMDGKSITVAMTHPDDLAARQSLVDSLESEIYVVQAPPQEMERMLNELWPSTAIPQRHFLSWSPNAEIAAQVEPYAQSFAQLMDAQLSSIKSTQTAQRGGKFLSSEVRRQHPDLVIFHSPRTLLPIWLLPHRTENLLIKELPVSLLVTRAPHLPLRNILLVLRDSKFDESAITWAQQIASKSRAAVTVLPVIAPAPPVFAGINFQQRSLINLLGSTCPLGETLRQISHSFSEQNIPGTLRLHEGTIFEQLQQEIEANDYDFVVIAADAQRSIVRWLMGELVNPLLGLAESPVLIAKN